MNIILAPRPSVSKKPSATRLLASISALAVAGTSSVYAANTTWNGNTDANFSTLANWTSVTPTGNSPQFGVAGSSGTTLNNDIVGGNYFGLVFNNGASAYTIGGNSFTLSADIINNSTSLQTINTAMTATAARTFNAASGQLAIGGNITGVGLTLSGANKITLSGTNTLTTNANFGNLTINGAGGVDITGATTLTGSSGNTFSGYLDVTGGGTVAIKSGGSLTINGTTNASHPNSAVTGGSIISVEGGSFTVGAGTGFNLGNSTATAGTLTVTSGTVTIHAGTTTDNGADTRFIGMGRDNNGATGTINLNGGTLATSRAFARDTSNGAGSGTANFVFGGGTLKALANQTDWLASTTSGLNANALALSSVTTTAVSTIDANGFSVAINNNISGSGGFNINSSTGTGTVIFGGTNTYTGPTTVTSGTLTLGLGASSTSATFLADSSNLFLTTGSLLNLSFTSNSVMESISGLFIDGQQQSAGTWGAVGSGANFESSLITGTGFLNVTSAVPEPSTYAALAGALTLGTVVVRRRRPAAV